MTEGQGTKVCAGTHVCDLHRDPTHGTVPTATMLSQMQGADLCAKQPQLGAADMRYS